MNINKYKCSVCGVDDNPICTAKGISEPHSCPYNLGDFKWETDNQVDSVCACEKCTGTMTIICNKCGLPFDIEQD